MSLAMELIGLQGLLLLMAWILPTNSVLFFIRMTKVMFLSYHTFIITIKLIELFSNPLYCPQIDITTLKNFVMELPVWTPIE